MAIDIDRYPIWFTVSSNMGITSKYIDRYPTASMTNNPLRDHYLACHPKVLSCKQQIIAISKVHNVSNVTQRNHTAVLSLVATTHL